MAHFYASIDGSSRTGAARRGTKKSGIHGHIRGWGLGVSVHGHYDGEKGEDVFEIFATPGSTGNGETVSIGVLRRKPEEHPKPHIVIPTAEERVRLDSTPES